MAKCNFTAPGGSTPLGTSFGRLPVVYEGDPMDVAWYANYGSIDLALVQQYTDSSPDANHTEFQFDSTVTQMTWNVSSSASLTSFPESANGPVYYWNLQDHSNSTNNCTSGLFRILARDSSTACTAAPLSNASSTAIPLPNVSCTAPPLSDTQKASGSSRSIVGKTIGATLGVVLGLEVAVFVIWMFAKTRKRENSQMLTETSPSIQQKQQRQPEVELSSDNPWGEPNQTWRYEADGTPASSSTTTPMRQVYMRS